MKLHESCTALRQNELCCQDIMIFVELCKNARRSSIHAPASDGAWQEQQFHPLMLKSSHIQGPQRHRLGLLQVRDHQRQEGRGSSIEVRQTMWPTNLSLVHAGHKQGSAEKCILTVGAHSAHQIPSRKTLLLQIATSMPCVCCA